MSLKETLKELQKKFGTEAIFQMGDEPTKIDVIPTGSIILNKALGIGGYPKGRITEIYGPESSGKTTLILHAIAESQKMGGAAAFIDAEHALDTKYAKNIGVKIENLIISQPDFGEQALDIVDELIRSNDIDIIVVDSVAALVPRAELEGDMGQAHMGLQARLMSQALRKMTGILSKTNTVLIFTNQIRSKIGIVYGCLHYNSRIILENGSSEKIGKIVNQKIKTNVLSYNKITKKIESRPIINWYNNGKGADFKQIIIKYPHKSGRSTLAITENHLIPTPTGEKYVHQLKEGDDVYIKSYNYLNKDQFDVVMGTFLGDGSLNRRSRNDLVSSMQFKHGIKQESYCKWKIQQFPKEFIGSVIQDKIGRTEFVSKPTNELYQLKQYKNKKAMRKIDIWLSDQLSPRSIAIWYLDDGHFNIAKNIKWGKGRAIIAASKLDEQSKKIVIDKIEKLGLGKAYSRPNLGIYFNSEETWKFHQAIAKYVPKCMSYKIHPKLQYLCETFVPSEENNVSEVLITSKIIKIYNKPKHRYEGLYKYDIEVENNHNYFVDNVLVHNSPETTTGGNALKFYASIRLDIRRRNKIEKEDKIVGNDIEIKVVKNRLAAPFQEAKTRIMYGVGLYQLGELLDYHIDIGNINKAGAWFKYKDQNIQGADNMILYIQEHIEEFKI